jgi:demethylmenaquinone methyltransferase/2-methoxy-6-polyprenyl-1,4-benzoquinol methylase
VSRDPASNRQEDAAEPIWSDQALADPHGTADKAHRVRAMFTAVAHRYDLNNRLHSMWRDQAWRRAAVRACRVKTTDVVLDVACGTGDLALAFAEARARRVVGADFTHAMLTRAEQKTARRARQSVHFIEADALALPLADASVDVVSIAFGIRNVSDVDRALGEFARVLRPGGRLLVLEFTVPANRMVAAMHRLYCHHIMPRTASWISGDRSGAYRYLPRSVTTFDGPSELAERIKTVGLQMVQLRPLSFGIAAIYLAQKTASRASA